MDALYCRVSSDRQTTENQFKDLLEVAEKDGSERDWSQIRQEFSTCILETQTRTRNRRNGVDWLATEPPTNFEKPKTSRVTAERTSPAAGPTQFARLLCGARRGRI